VTACIDDYLARRLSTYGYGNMVDGCMLPNLTSRWP